MELNPEEVKAGQLWFLVAGGLAVLLSFALFNIDHGLSTSKAELIKGQQLNELRMAQTTLSGEESDQRVSGNFLAHNRPAADLSYDGEFHPRVDFDKRVGNVVPDANAKGQHSAHH